MVRSKAVSGACVALLFLLMVACFRPSIPISTGTVYPIDVFMENQTPDRPYSEIEWVAISQDDTLSAKQKADNTRMTSRGNDAQTKDLLTARLVLKAQKLGADAIMKVNYQYYTSATMEGYTMKGLAIKYRGD
ncbi:hypothetical protein [Persicitalea jodogahamensis]|uniref:Uncharacterized protein n=2 Tax=Persicitalea jodogahamensis TaxID=402147 RepID=A0A8J3D5F0_9BACT|nr:hypothetical protein GCM10007390_33800 [Persicitalea jodogahamensis]